MCGISADDHRSRARTSRPISINGPPVPCRRAWIVGLEDRLWVIPVPQASPYPNVCLLALREPEQPFCFRPEVDMERGHIGAIQVTRRSCPCPIRLECNVPVHNDILSSEGGSPMHRRATPPVSSSRSSRPMRIKVFGISGSRGRAPGLSSRWAITHGIAYQPYPITSFGSHSAMLGQMASSRISPIISATKGSAPQITSAMPPRDRMPCTT